MTDDQEIFECGIYDLLPKKNHWLKQPAII